MDKEARLLQMQDSIGGQRAINKLIQELFKEGLLCVQIKKIADKMYDELESEYQANKLMIEIPQS